MFLATARVRSSGSSGKLHSLSRSLGGSLSKLGSPRGMCVLDIGSGVGDVTFLAADLVGEAGHVTGIDQSNAALAIARTRSGALGLGNVGFEETSLTEFRSGQQFDAIVGRYILMYMPDAAAVLRRLVQHLRPGGLLCRHEPSWASARSFPPVPSWERCSSLVVRAWTPEAVVQSGARPAAAAHGAEVSGRRRPAGCTRSGHHEHASFRSAVRPPPSIGRVTPA